MSRLALYLRPVLQSMGHRQRCEAWAGSCLWVAGHEHAAVVVDVSTKGAAPCARARVQLWALTVSACSFAARDKD